MNTDKTRIMTTTTGRSVLDAHIQHNHTVGLELKEAITTYSTKNSKMYEETNGLRILGSPVGSITFQKAFIADYLQKLKTDASNLLDKLEDDQTIIQLYRQCTSQRLNHLFPADASRNGCGTRSVETPPRISPRSRKNPADEAGFYVSVLGRGDDPLQVVHLSPEVLHLFQRG